MLCVGQKIPYISRLIPLLSQRTFIHGMSNNISLCRGVVKGNVSLHAFQPVVHSERPAARWFTLSARNLAGDQKSDYILHHNTITEVEKRDIESSVKKDFEDWVPYGFCPTDKEEDIYRYKLFMFSCMTLLLVTYIYLMMHIPPRNQREWVTREAYLELERRQRLGLPLVDKNLIPVDKILLPSLEELGDDYDIII